MNEGHGVVDTHDGFLLVDYTAVVTGRIIEIDLALNYGEPPATVSWVVPVDQTSTPHHRARPSMRVAATEIDDPAVPLGSPAKTSK